MRKAWLEIGTGVLRKSVCKSISDTAFHCLKRVFSTTVFFFFCIPDCNNLKTRSTCQCSPKYPIKLFRHGYVVWFGQKNTWWNFIRMNILTVDPVEIQEMQNIIDLASTYSRVIVQKDITAVIPVTKWIFTGKSTGTKKPKKKNRDHIKSAKQKYKPSRHLASCNKKRLSQSPIPHFLEFYMWITFCWSYSTCYLRVCN